MARTGRPGCCRRAWLAKTRVPGATAEAIALLVRLTGTNEASVLRGLIHAGLEPHALVSPEVAAIVTTTTQKEN